MMFPNVDGENLDGRPFAFPADFGSRAIVLVAFDFKHRGELESWVPFVEGYARAGTLNGFVLPVISRSMRMMKGVVLATMRKGAPSPEARAATVPVFVDIDDFCAVACIEDRSTIHVFVVEGGGAVLEHQIGPHTEAAAAAITARVHVSA